MEYERQSREARQHAQSYSSPGVSLSGPVGLRGRITNVANSQVDQEKVISLLASIPIKDGGKQGVWAVPPSAGPPGRCPQFLADAIWEFQSWWKALGVFRNIDGVIDPGGNTLRQLNKLSTQNRTSPAPGPGPQPPGVIGLRSDPGEWWITGVDTFGLPIKAGVTAAKIGVSLLNDQGEKYTINAYGGGVAVGADLELDKFGKILGKIAEIGMKPGDIPNIHKKLSFMSFYSKTVGGIFKGARLTSHYTIHDITEAQTMTITSAAASTHYGFEIGLITFFPSGMSDPINFSIMLGRIAAGQPWGAYGSFSGGKLTAEVGISSYTITSVDKE